MMNRKQYYYFKINKKIKFKIMYYIKINNILLDNKMCLIYDFYINNLI